MGRSWLHAQHHLSEQECTERHPARLMGNCVEQCYCYFPVLHWPPVYFAEAMGTTGTSTTEARHTVHALHRSELVVDGAHAFPASTTLVNVH